MRPTPGRPKAAAPPPRGVANYTEQGEVRSRGAHTISAMSAASPIDQIAERVERLLVRHEEVQRTNALLQEQVEVLTRERDALKSRLSAARARLDAVLEKLPLDDTSSPNDGHA